MGTMSANVVVYTTLILLVIFNLKLHSYSLSGCNFIRSMKMEEFSIHKWVAQSRPGFSAAQTAPTHKTQTKTRAMMMANPERLNAINDKKTGGLQFFDEATVYVRAGSGGAGAATFHVGKNFQRGKPNGGSGGRGGDIVLECDPSLNTLQGLRGTATFEAPRGGEGGALLKNGANAADVTVKVPPGTIVYEEPAEGAPRTFLGELTLAAPGGVGGGERLVVARGGQGGMGNAASKAARGQSQKATPPRGGRRRRLRLELRVVADLGLVGVPNAGKSTLLAATSNARPKIANYPFTTLVPNLGVCEPDALGFRGRGMVLADIPGLLEGAHKGIGLGREFLRHVDRCKAILHLVDGSSQDPVGDFTAINQELVLFNPNLAHKPQVVVITKTDLTEVREKIESGLEENLKEKMGHGRLLAISAVTGDNVRTLMERTRKLLDKIEEKERLKKVEEHVAETQCADDETDSSDIAPLEGIAGRIKIMQLSVGNWKLSNPQLEYMVDSMDWQYYGTEGRLIEFLSSTEILKRIFQAGAKTGDRILIGDKGFCIPDMDDS